MNENFTYPTITIESKIVSSYRDFNDAVLVKVEKGVNKLRFISQYDEYQVILNGENLFSGRDDVRCPTCDYVLHRGYRGDGERNVSMEERMELGGKINAEYIGIEQAVERIGAVLGLLRDGYYVVADYELFPNIGKKHFWNCHYSPGPFGGQIEDPNEDKFCMAPAELIATERATVCNPERVEYYRQRLEEQEQYPRAIGCYLGGGSVLLLDGHHKATAAAANGEMVKCLVIMPAFLDSKMPSIEMENKKTKLLQIYWGLYDGAARRIGCLESFFDRYAEKEEEVLCTSEDFSDWGEIPTEYSLLYGSYKRSGWDYKSLPPGWEQNPRTANLCKGVFSYYAGQTKIDEIPELLSLKLKKENIKTVLIPNTVQEINREVFRFFPHLEKVIVEAGSPYFTEADFEKELLEIRRKREEKKAVRRETERLGYYPFANLHEFLEGEYIRTKNECIRY